MTLGTGSMGSGVDAVTALASGNGKNFGSKLAGVKGWASH
jgi:hypothetical protein